MARSRDRAAERRRTGWVDDSIRDVIYALRGFRRAPLATFTIVATVALGLGLVAVAFTILNSMLFRLDGVPDVNAMYAVRPQATGGEREPFTRAQLEALLRETNVFAGAYGEQLQVDSRIDGRLTFGTFVTGTFFQVLGVHAAVGRTLTPADDEQGGGQPVMVLSHRGWDRLFARDPAIVGRRVLVNGATFEIVGVMPGEFRGLTITPDDYWAPLSSLGFVRDSARGREASIGIDIVGRLKPGVARQAAVAQLAAWDAAQPHADPGERGGASRITLVPRRGVVEHPLEVVPITAPLFFAFGLILLIGCANVANLLLARAVSRRREIGIQLSLGASRLRIVRQLMTEGLLLALAAAGAGFAISRVVLAVAINQLAATLPPDIGDIRLLIPDADWRVALFLVAGAGVSTMAFALAPALQATRVEPISTIRGDIAGSARPSRARNFLVGMQVGASALLLICAAVFLRSAWESATYDPGMRTSDTVMILVANEVHRNAIVRAVTLEPGVDAVAALSPEPTPRLARAETGGSSAKVDYKLVSPEIFSVLDIGIVRGREFSGAERMPSLPIAIVSETTAGSLWPGADPIGQILRIGPEPAAKPGRAGDPPIESRTLTVAGVARDVPGLRIAPFNRAVVYVPASAGQATMALVARVHGDPELARQTLLDRLTAIDPDMGRQVITMRTLVTMDTVFLKFGFWLTVALGGLALALTVSGLFSVLSYVVAQRTREIGVRMALGATTRDVAQTVLAQSFRPVAIGLLVGGGSAAALAALLLSSSAAAAIGDVVHVLDPVAYVASLLIIVAACLAAAAIPAARAARLDPALTLRQE